MLFAVVSRVNDHNLWKNVRMTEPFAVRIEDFLRDIILARILPTIRTRFPWMHRLLLNLRDRLLPLPRGCNLTRYQYRAVQKFISLAKPLGALDIVLEIGSDTAGQVMDELVVGGVKMVVGANPVVEAANLFRNVPAGSSDAHLSQSDARWLPFSAATFTSIFSVAAFEHIQNLDIALLELHRVLKDGGVIYAEFGPIWSCSVGHHVYAKVNGEEARHWKPGLNPVPNYGHLFLSPEELEDALSTKVSDKLLEAIIEWIYIKDDINRLFFEDYVRILHASPFEVLSLRPVGERVNRRIQTDLERIYPGYQEFGCRIIEVALKKSGDLGICGTKLAL